MNVTAGIVTYNPDALRLRENLTAVFADVGEAILVDNASTSLEFLDEVALAFPGLHIVRNHTNHGIAYALNQIVSWAQAQHQDWVLLLDQDSVCSPGMVATLTSRTGSEGVAIIVPEIVDRNLVGNKSSELEAVDVDFAITSGSLISTAGWELVGGYDESLFIDFVDFDFCLRVRTNGFRIVRDPRASLLHQIGDSKRHGRLIAYNHSAFRSYHMARDMIIYSRKHRTSPAELKVHRRGLAFTYLILLRKATIVAIYEEDRTRKVGALFRGIADETFRRRRRR